MGNLIQKVFGGSDSSSTSNSSSSNRAYDTLAQYLTPALSYTTTGGNALSSLLSGNGSGFDAYKTAAGYDATQSLGEQGVMANMRAQGLGTSGAAMKALANYNNTLNDNMLSQYLSGLTGLSSLGTSAANSLSGAGSVSSSTSQSTGQSYTGGLGKALGYGSSMAGG